MLSFPHRRRFALALTAAVALCTLGAGDTPLIREKIEFKKANGDEAFRLDPEAGGVELQLPGEKKLAAYERVGDKIHILLKKSSIEGTVEASKKHDRYTLRGADGKKVERILAVEPDGDWQVLDANEKLLRKLKLRDNGFKVVDAEDQEVGRIKVSKDKISLRDVGGKEVLYTKSSVHPLAAACFQLDGVTLPAKGALAVAIILWPPKEEKKKE